jgi:hypothetical protein
MAFSILTFIIMAFNKLKLSKNDIQYDDIQQKDIKYNDTQNNVAFVLVLKRHHTECLIFSVMLSAIIPNVIMANVVAPEDVMRERDEAVYGKHPFVSNQVFLKEISLKLLIFSLQPSKV